MKKYIAILRGINVGGHKKILMADLKQLFLDLNFYNVVTYIQSGNVIFGSEKQFDSIKSAYLIEQSISKSYSFDVPVIVKTFEEIKNSISLNPYLKVNQENIEKLYWKNTYASSTPISDGERVIAFFGNSGFVCYDMNGDLQWTQSVGEFITTHGPGTNIVMYKNKVIFIRIHP